MANRCAYIFTLGTPWHGPNIVHYTRVFVSWQRYKVVYSFDESGVTTSKTVYTNDNTPGKTLKYLRFSTRYTFSVSTQLTNNQEGEPVHVLQTTDAFTAPVGNFSAKLKARHAYLSWTAPPQIDTKTALKVRVAMCAPLFSLVDFLFPTHQHGLVLCVPYQNNHLAIGPCSLLLPLPLPRPLHRIVFVLPPLPSSASASSSSSSYCICSSFPILLCFRFLVLFIVLYLFFFLLSRPPLLPLPRPLHRFVFVLLPPLPSSSASPSSLPLPRPLHRIVFVLPPPLLPLPRPLHRFVFVLLPPLPFSSASPSSLPLPRPLHRFVFVLLPPLPSSSASPSSLPLPPFPFLVLFIVLYLFFLLPSPFVLVLLFLPLPWRPLCPPTPPPQVATLYPTPFQPPNNSHHNYHILSHHPKHSVPPTKTTTTSFPTRSLWPSVLVPRGLLRQLTPSCRLASAPGSTNLPRVPPFYRISVI